MSPDYTCCQELAWQARKRMMQEIGVDRVARPDKVIMVVDHTTSAAMGSPYYLSHREMKDFACTQRGREFLRRRHRACATSC